MMPLLFHPTAKMTKLCLLLMSGDCIEENIEKFFHSTPFTYWHSRESRWKVD